MSLKRWIELFWWISIVILNVLHKRNHDYGVVCLTSDLSNYCVQILINEGVRNLDISTFTYIIEHSIAFDIINVSFGEYNSQFTFVLNYIIIAFQLSPYLNPVYYTYHLFHHGHKNMSYVFVYLDTWVALSISQWIFSTKWRNNERAQSQTILNIRRLYHDIYCLIVK